MSEVVWVESQLHSTVFGTYAESATALDAGITYVVTVEGNWTTYGTASLSPVHIPIVYPTGGQRDASCDAEVWFAATGSDATGRPSHFSGILFDTGDGSGFVHPEPIGGPFSTIQPGHLYTYSIVGAGYPLKGAIGDTPISDNSGKVKVTIESIGWFVGQVVGFPA